MQMLDASPFSRALWYMDLAPLSKLIENKPEIVVGRATNLDGYLVEVGAQKWSKALLNCLITRKSS
jgi:hypothetical protein